MNNGPPITSNAAFARHEPSPIQGDDQEAMPGDERDAPDEVPTIAPSPETAAASPSSTPSETTVAPAPATRGVGVLIVNLGTPDAPTPAGVRRFLKEFLTDRRVIEKNSLAWKALLNAVILPLRSRRRARDYEKIWNRDKDESPIKTITRSQAEKLGGILEPRCDRRAGVTHGPIDDDMLAKRLEDPAELFRLRAGDRFDWRFVLVAIPDFLIVAGSTPRAQWQDNGVEERLPLQRILLDHTLVGQKLLQVTPHRRGRVRIRSAEIDEEHADTAGRWRRRNSRLAGC